MLAIFAYLGAVAALFAGAAFGLMVLIGESGALGKNLGAYSDARIAATAKPVRTAAAELDASAAARTTGQAARSDRPAAKEVRPKPPKNRSAHIDKRKKRTAQVVRELR
jgi:hypothetical protein